MLSPIQTKPLKRIGDVAATASGTTPSRAQKDYWQPAKVPWVKTAEIAFAPIRSTEEAVSHDAIADCSLPLLPPGSVLIAMYGQGKTRGQSAVLEIEATTNQACFAVLPNDTFLPSYLQYWLQLSYSSLRSLSDGRGGNQANLNGEMLRDLRVPWVELTKQQNIVQNINAQLAEVETARAAVTAQLRDVQALTDAIFRGAFTSFAQRANPHIETVRLEEICSIEASLVDPTKPAYRDLPHVSAENITSISGLLHDLTSASEDRVTSGKYLFDAGDILYSKLRPYLRKVTIAKAKGVCSADMYPIKVNAKRITPNYLRFVLVGPDFTDYANEMSARTRMPKLNREQLFDYKFSLPSLEQQSEIETRLLAAAHEIEILRSSIQTRLAEINLLPQKILSAAFEM